MSLWFPTMEPESEPLRSQDYGPTLMADKKALSAILPYLPESAIDIIFDYLAITKDRWYLQLHKCPYTIFDKIGLFRDSVIYGPYFSIKSAEKDKSWFTGKFIGSGCSKGVDCPASHLEIIEEPPIGEWPSTRIISHDYDGCPEYDIYYSPLMGLPEYNSVGEPDYVKIKESLGFND